jgi:serine/threonine protein kinase
VTKHLVNDPLPFIPSRIFALAATARQIILYDVARGLVILEERKLVHCDLQLANIVLNRHGYSQLIKVGFPELSAKSKRHFFRAMHEADQGA